MIEPKIGEIRGARDIGRNTCHAYDKFVWVACPYCNKPRWIGYYQYLRGQIRCMSCAVQERYKEGKHGGKWQGGRFRDKSGYMLIWLDANDSLYPMATKNRRKMGSGYCWEHRYVVAKYLGRQLKDTEIVHHLNGRKADNRIENLALLARKNHNTTTLRQAMQNRIRDLEVRLAQQRLPLMAESPNILGGL